MIPDLFTIVCRWVLRSALIFQAERARQQEEYEASTAFKNQIHRLDADEAAFLAKIDREKCLMQESVDQEAEQLIQEAKISFSSALNYRSALESFVFMFSS